LIRRSNTFSRIRVLSTAEINRRALNIDIESGIEPVLPPLLRAPAQFHGTDSPTHDIVEYPLQSILENQILPTLTNDPSSDDDRNTILLEEGDLFEDVNDINKFDPLLTSADYDPVQQISEEPQEGNTDNVEDPTLSQLIEELLTDEEYLRILFLI